MPRARMIKPEFWDDEKLATTTSRDARLVFIGIWNFADDYGVVKGSAIWLKNHILPYEDSLSPHEFEKWLIELENGKWILPFFHGGQKFYFIRTFPDHQTINRPSKQRNPIPPNTLIEDSLSVQGALMDKIEREIEIEREGKENARDARTSPPPCPVQEIIKIYHETCPELPRVVSINGVKTNLKNRWREPPEHQTLEWWKTFFENEIRTSDFLMGRSKDFQCNFGWIVGPQNFSKILNGQYRNRGPNTGTALGDANARACMAFLQEGVDNEE